MSKHFKENTKDLAYFLNTYKLKGHTTWRAHLSGHAGGFKAEQKAWAAGPNPPTITDVKTYKLDRVTGEIKLV